MLPKPDVFKSLSSDTYVIFGQAENMASQAHSKWCWLGYLVGSKTKRVMNA